MEGDEEQGAWFVKFFAFQSTPSVWRETGKTSSDLQTYDISIHSLRVEGDSTNVTTEGADDISIHSLRVEGDHICYRIGWRQNAFQSTPSVWRETVSPPIYRL